MKGKSQTFPLQLLPLMSILNSCESLKYGLFTIAIPITCLNIGLKEPDLNSPINLLSLF